MRIALIFLGLFLWFSLAFNGSVGEPFVNYSFSFSAFLMVISGSLKIVKPESNLAKNICIAALITYLPMIWQRFNFTPGTNWIGFLFDIGIVIFMVVFIASKPNKALKEGTPLSGAP